MSTAYALTKGHFSWGDYRAWPDDERWEIIGGEAFAMTPAPTTRHQRIVARLYASLAAYFANHKCEALLSPIDVKLSDQDIVQPDLVVVCDPGQIKRTHIEGPPTLVVEVLSPATEAYDRLRKRALYAEKGIQELWLVTPYPWLAEIFSLDQGTYRLAGTYSKEDTAVSPAFPGLEIDLAPVFDFPIDPDEEIPMIKEGRPGYGKAGERGRGNG